MGAHSRVSPGVVHGVPLSSAPTTSEPRGGGSTVYCRALEASRRVAIQVADLFPKGFSPVAMRLPVIPTEGGLI